MTVTHWAKLVPELAVIDYARSKDFYRKAFGFNLLFERLENGFGYFELNGAQLMLLQTQASDLYQLTDNTPRGRGLHFQIEVDDVRLVLQKLEQHNWPLVKPLSTQWYRVDTVEHGSQEFFVCDPDGYLFRFYQSVGERSAL